MRAGARVPRLRRAGAFVVQDGEPVKTQTLPASCDLKSQLAMGVSDYVSRLETKRSQSRRLVNEPAPAGYSLHAHTTDLTRVGVRPDRGDPACRTMWPGPTATKRFLFIRKQPKQNLPDPGGFIGELLEAFHGIHFATLVALVVRSPLAGKGPGSLPVVGRLEAGNGGETGRWGISWR